jgi:hypothetical protein
MAAYRQPRKKVRGYYGRASLPSSKKGMKMATIL